METMTLEQVQVRDQQRATWNKFSAGWKKWDELVLSWLAPVGNGRRPGGSTWQSLARGTPVEVDYLNGEIVLLARLHGVAAPVNELLQRATHRAAVDGAAPGSIPAADLLARL